MKSIIKLDVENAEKNIKYLIGRSMDSRFSIDSIEFEEPFWNIHEGCKHSKAYICKFVLRDKDSQESIEEKSILFKCIHMQYDFFANIMYGFFECEYDSSGVLCSELIEKLSLLSRK